MGQQPDAMSEIAPDGHLLAIKQGDLFPSRSSSCDGGGEAGVQIGGHRERHRKQLMAAECIALDQGVNQLGHGLVDRIDGVVAGGGDTTSLELRLPTACHSTPPVRACARIALGLN